MRLNEKNTPAKFYELYGKHGSVSELSQFRKNYFNFSASMSKKENRDWARKHPKVKVNWK